MDRPNTPPGLWPHGEISEGAKYSAPARVGDRPRDARQSPRELTGWRPLENNPPPFSLKASDGGLGGPSESQSGRRWQRFGLDRILDRVSPRRERLLGVDGQGYPGIASDCPNLE
jgi:hypothetical protein